MGLKHRWVQHTILIVLLVLGTAAIVSFLREGSGPPAAGDAAPRFTAAGLDGHSVSLSELKGRPKVLNFWGTFCQPCREEMPALQKQADQWVKEGVQVIGMNLGENGVTVRSYLEQHGIRFPVYLDTDDSIRQAYGVNQFPTTFFIRPDGTILKIRVGQMDEAFIEQSVRELLAKG